MWSDRRLIYQARIKCFAFLMTAIIGAYFVLIAGNIGVADETNLSGSGGSSSPPWEDIGNYKKVDYTELARDIGLRGELFFADATTGELLTFDLASEALSRNSQKISTGEFLCLTPGKPGMAYVSACRSSGKWHKPLVLQKLEVRELISIPESEIDATRYLKAGENTQLSDIYGESRYTYIIDQAHIFGQQKFGTDNNIADCIYISRKIGGIILQDTETRPHFLGILKVLVGEYDSQKYVGRFLLRHLESVFDRKAYVCRQAITVGAETILIVSDETIILIDLRHDRYGLAALAAKPRYPAIAQLLGKPEGAAQ